MDEVNALFELGGGVLLWLNVKSLWKDKQVRGVSFAPFAFYLGWGIWNLFYYPALGQIWSAIAGVNVVLANLAWVVLALRFRRQ